MPQPAKPRKVSRRSYWKQRVNASPTASARLGAACDYLRAEAARYPDQEYAQKLLNEEADRLMEVARKLGRKNW
ncbi:MAG: hypothetical protein JWO67_3987 [Streptosporangiaceae bacterium]|nr:hypothetical protein [Streptosporangiaceae bacterium]